jgi:hypothetical protein
MPLDSLVTIVLSPIVEWLQPIGLAANTPAWEGFGGQRSNIPYYTNTAWHASAAHSSSSSLPAVLHNHYQDHAHNPPSTTRLQEAGWRHLPHNLQVTRLLQLLLLLYRLASHQATYCCRVAAQSGPCHSGLPASQQLKC